MLRILLPADKAYGLEMRSYFCTTTDAASESLKDSLPHIRFVVIQASLLYSYERVLHQPLTLSFAPIENELSGTSYSPQLSLYERICCNYWFNARLSHQVSLHLQKSLICEHELVKISR